MKVVVCFKIVHDLDQVLLEDWNIVNSNRVDVSYAGLIYSCYDEIALELALRLKQENPDIDLTALTIGNIGERLLKNLMALGFSRVVQVRTECELEFNPNGIAGVLSAFLQKEGGYDLVLTGKQAGISDSGQVPFLVAEALGYPCIANVEDVTLECGQIVVRNHTGVMKGRFVLGESAVLSVGNVADCYLRIPTLKDKLGVKNKKVEVIALDELGIEKEQFQKGTQGLFALVQCPEKEEGHECRLIEGGSLEEKAERLLDWLERNKKER